MSNQVTTETKPKSFGEMLKLPAYQEQIAQALPRGLTAERLTRVVLTAMNKTPKLLECSRESIWESVLNCASLGLFPDALGRAYLVPYKGKCQLIIGYKGLIDLAYRSERIGMIQIRPVFTGDHFVYDFGLSPKLEHRPCDTPGELTHVYSIVHIKGADMPTFDVMRKDEVDAIRRRSQSRDNGPWVTDYAAMAMKTVFKRHSKVLPMSAELAQAMDADDDRLDLELKQVSGTVVNTDSRLFSDDTPTPKQLLDEKTAEADRRATENSTQEITIDNLKAAALGKDAEDVDRVLSSFSSNSYADLTPDQLGPCLIALKALKAVK